MAAAAGTVASRPGPLWRLRPRPLPRQHLRPRPPRSGFLACGGLLSAVGLLLLPSRGLAKRISDGDARILPVLTGFEERETLTCCCKPSWKLMFKPCKYREVEADGKKKCCKMRRGGCPKMSFYTPEDPERCYGNKQDIFERFRLHPKYEFVGLHDHAPLKASGDLRPLGEGASARVYLAQDMKSKKLVAIKVPITRRVNAKLHGECASVGVVRQRVASGDTSAFGGSQHLVACVEDDFAFDPPFVVLEYAGNSPYTALSTHGPRPLLGLLKQVFLGLASLYRSRPPQLHHDLKWDNVVVDDEGCLKIIDLETVIESSWWNLDAETVTTPEFAPPEANRTNFVCGANYEDEYLTCPLGYTFDAYSAGVMMASVLCGAPEFWLSGEPGHLPGTKYDLAVWMSLHEFGRTGIVEQVELLRRNANEGNGSDPWHKAFREKLDFCEEQLRLRTEERPAGGLQVVDDLRQANAKLRPDPIRVLQDDLFLAVPTGCRADAVFATAAAAAAAPGPGP